MRDVILLPTYNERENVEWLIPEIFKICPEIHVLVIDDNSPDGTAQVVQKLMATYPQLKLLSRPGKQGLGEAYKDALSRLKDDPTIRAFITMDADGSHRPSYLPELLSRVGDYDLVIGSRYVKSGGVRNWEAWRRFLSAGGNFYARTLTGLSTHDLTAGFLCFRREVLNKIDWRHLSAAGYAFLMEFKFLIDRAGGLIYEVPIIFHERRGGESKISRQIIREGFKIPWRLFWKRLWKI